MGNTFDTSSSLITNFIDDYRYVETTEDRRLGDIKLFANKQTNNMVIVKDIIVEDEASMEYYKNNLKNFDTSNSVF